MLNTYNHRQRLLLCELLQQKTDFEKSVFVCRFLAALLHETLLRNASIAGIELLGSSAAVRNG